MILVIIVCQSNIAKEGDGTTYSTTQMLYFDRGTKIVLREFSARNDLE